MHAYTQMGILRALLLCKFDKKIKSELKKIISNVTVFINYRQWMETKLNTLKIDILNKFKHNF